MLKLSRRRGGQGALDAKGNPGQRPWGENEFEWQEKRHKDNAGGKRKLMRRVEEGDAGLIGGAKWYRVLRDLLKN